MRLISLLLLDHEAQRHAAPCNRDFCVKIISLHYDAIIKPNTPHFVAIFSFSLLNLHFFARNASFRCSSFSIPLRYVANYSRTFRFCQAIVATFFAFRLILLHSTNIGNPNRHVLFIIQIHFASFRCFFFILIFLLVFRSVLLLFIFKLETNRCKLNAYIFFFRIFC